ncbi:MAG: flagellar assembly protein FliW [Proteobacteria bacterium]|nr:flagellar assembly protein FliW [Pseudomonadota bacterium]MBU1639855.1 flagellar assembly protein FliW [Pseudomonadota bacterium]
MSAAVQEQTDNGLAKIHTTRFGELEIQVDKIITMTTPFLGFPDSHRFIMRQNGGKSPFMWLQSLDDPDLAFVVIPAAALIPQYTPEIPASALKDLQTTSTKPEILLILTIPPGKPLEMTANLLGPIVLNTDKRLACQVLLDPAVYDVRWPVFTETND